QLETELSPSEATSPGSLASRPRPRTRSAATRPAFVGSSRSRTGPAPARSQLGSPAIPRRHGTRQDACLGACWAGRCGPVKKWTSTSSSANASRSSSASVRGTALGSKALFRPNQKTTRPGAAHARPCCKRYDAMVNVANDNGFVEPFPDRLAASKHFRHRGLKVVAANGKNPNVTGEGWPERTTTEADLERWFGNSSTLNIGIQQGACSGNLADADLDVPAA